MKLNKERYLANKMPKNPTYEQRMKRRLEHNKHCQCHLLSAELQQELKEFTA